MPSINYGAGAYRRDNGNFPPLTLINMYVEQAKTSEGGVALLSRPGLGLIATNGSGPINGLFCKAGTLSGDVFSISDTTLYRGTTSLGSISTAGSGAARFAGGIGEVLVTRGGTLRSYNGTNIADAGFTGNSSNNVTAVTFIGSLFVAAEAGSARFFWSAALNGRSWDVLDFATAEREPDSLLDIEALGDNIWLFGQQTVEAWAHTGDATLPFTRLENVAFDKGIHSTGCVTRADNSLFFVGSDRVVYRVADVPARVSDHGIEERILASTTCRVFAFKREGHEFVAIRLDTETLLYDCATQEWCEFQTNGGQWIVSHAVMQDKVAYFGHQTTGELMGWSEWDDMGDELERRFTFAAPLDEALSVDRIHIWCNAGQTPLVEGQGSSPTVEIRLSDDAGNTFTDWEGDELGAQGTYRQVPEWRALGMFDFPGLLGECRVTDPVPFRVSAVKVNDKAGGRQRV